MKPRNLLITFALLALISAVFYLRSTIYHPRSNPPPSTIHDLSSTIYRAPDTTIVPTGGDYAYGNTTNNFQTSFKADPLATGAIKFQNSLGSIAFATEQSQSFGTLREPESTTTDKNALTYANLFPGLDVRYTLSPTRLLEEFVVKDLATAQKITRLTQSAETTGVDSYLPQDGSLVFSRGATKAFVIPRPVLYEAAHPDTRSFGITYDVKATGSHTYSITKVVTAEGAIWLADPKRVYPIVIDLVIDNADTVANWVSSDTNNLVETQEGTIVEQGTGSVKLVARSPYGTGADGACTVSSNLNINTGTCVGRGSADGVLFTSTVNTTAGSSAITLSATPTGLAAGDEVLIINEQGAYTNMANVGQYETKYISSISTNTLNLEGTLTNGYDGTTQKIVVQRIPQYTNVTVNGGITLTANAWNGTSGGIVTFRASGTVNVAGSINVATYGFSGGPGGLFSSGGRGGDAFCGVGGTTGVNTASSGAAGGGGGFYQSYAGGTGYCGGGGGLNGTGSASSGGSGAGGAQALNGFGGGGGGAGYGTAGVGGTNSGGSGGTNSSGNGSTGTYPAGGGGGGTYGSSNLTRLYLGSGGGGGGGTAGANGVNTTGGQGGGIIYVGAYSLTVSGSIIANGSSGAVGVSSTGSGGAGGGAGGSILLSANSYTLGSSLVTATGGGGGGNGGGNGGTGGTGGSGRIAAALGTGTGTTNPTFNNNGTPARAAGATSTLTTTSTDLSSYRYLIFWVRSPRTGTFAQFQFGEVASNEQTFPFTINSANTWEQKTLDISGISAGSRNAVTKYAFKITDDSQNTVLYFDNIFANSPPTIPTLDVPGTGTTTTLTPALKTTATDADADYLRYKIVLCTNTLMTLGCQTFDETSSQTGWSGQNTQTSTAYTSGTQATYTLQSALSYSTTYYWQSYAIDPGGSNTWGSTQVTPLSFLTQYPPNVPTLDSPGNAATGQSTVPTLRTTATDANGDYVRYKIILCTNNTMTLGCQTFDETSSQTGWSGQNTQTSTAYTSGTQGVYTIQTPLTNNATYYWQSYAIDPGGLNTWSSAQSLPNSFTTGLAPSSPTYLETNGSLGPVTGINSTTPYFSAIHNDSAGLAATSYQVQVNTSADMTGTVMWDSGTTSMTSTPNGSRSPNISYAGSTLAVDGTRYYWRIRFTDTGGIVSNWSTIANFSTIENALSCTVKQDGTNTNLVVQWTNHAAGNTGYEVRRSVDSGAFSVLHTGLSASAVSDTDSTVTSGHTYQYQVAPYYSGPTYGPWCVTTTLSLQLGTFRLD